MGAGSWVGWREACGGSAVWVGVFPNIGNCAFKFVRKGVDTPFSRSLEIVPELSGASFLFKLWLNRGGGGLADALHTHPYPSLGPRGRPPSCFRAILTLCCEASCTRHWANSVPQPFPKLQRFPRGELAQTEPLVHIVGSISI